MKVVHYQNKFSPRSQTFIYDYVTELEKKGVKNYVLTHERVNKDERPFEKVIVVPAPSRWNLERISRRLLCEFISKPSFTSNWKQKRRRLKSRLAQLDPDIIHAHFGPPGVVIAPVAKELDIPCIVHFRGRDISALLTKSFWEREYQRLKKKASHFIGISGHICNKIRKLGVKERNISKLHTGVRLDKLSYNPPQKRFFGRVHCCHIGRLVEKKNPIKLVQAFKVAIEKLSDKKVSIKLTIAGDGPLYGPLQDEIERLNLRNHVECLGSISHRQVINLLNKCHIHTKYCETASNGDEEGQGVTFAEAHAIGLPVVSTNHNGIPEVVLNGKTGYLVDEGDVKSMGLMIAKMSTSIEQWDKFSLAGRKHVEENFDLITQTSSLLGIYNNILDQ